jgi:hypothetical protein
MIATSVFRQPEFVLPLLLLVAAGLVIGLRNWRWSVYGLLCYLPVAGIAVLIAYPGRNERAVAVLAKDFLFVIPAYLGFLWYFVSRRRRFWFRGAPVVLFLLLALIVVVQAFNPDLPRLLVGLIGIKIWLFYIPLFFLGYHLVQSRPQLFWLLGLMSAVAVLPAVVGLVEAILIYAGKESTVYSWYGDSAAAATQNFVVFTVPGGCTIRRIPSTFSFFYQYYLFLSAMLAVGYAWWRGGRQAGRQLKIGGALFVLLLVAAFVSGQRGAFLFTPFLVVLMLALSWRSRNRLPVVAVAGGLCAFAATALIVGGIACNYTSHIAKTFGQEKGVVITRSISEAVHETWLGLGAGADSTGARYAFPSATYSLRGGGVQEAWYVKTYLELGVFGLAIVLALLLTILVRSYKIHRRLLDPRLKVVSAAFVALIVWVLVYNAKAQYMDLDPINVYFWLFAGILFKLPLLQRPEPAGEAEHDPEPDRVAAGA